MPCPAAKLAVAKVPFFLLDALVIGVSPELYPTSVPCSFLTIFIPSEKDNSFPRYFSSGILRVRDAV